VKYPIPTLLAGCFVGVLAYHGWLNFNNEVVYPVATLPDGAQYEGEMTGGIINGRGRMSWASGAHYEGEFKDGLFHGQGRLEQPSGLIYEGDFTQGAITGKGTFLHTDGSAYHGELVHGEYQGKGTLTLSDGHYYYGQFVDGVFTGQGILVQDKLRYEGSFEDWDFHGEGALIKANGERYEGGFERGKYHGYGTLFFPKPIEGRTQVSGKWRHGQLVETDDTELLVDPETLAETALYNQNELLAAQSQNLLQNNPDAIELYFLGIGGDGTQGVFRRELTYVRDYFDKDLELEGKSVLLLNSTKTVPDIPLATRTSIESTLHSMAQKMDEDEDILFIYMSSHGFRNHQFSLKQGGIKLPDLGAQQLADILEDLPVRWKVIVVSACFSGGFIPLLQDENTLVITSAADDRVSFGCEDGNDFTYFGEAYFKDALPISEGFVDAFYKARDIIAVREKDAGFTASMPQIHTTPAIEKQLARWRSGS